jgi:16S rRNA (cytosine967-C5)-methyltransferase
MRSGKENPRQTVLKLLIAADNKKSHIGHLKESMIADIFPERDRRFAWLLVNGVLKRRALLDHIIDGFIRRKPSSKVQHILRIGLYQIMFMRVPAYAAINESVNLARYNGETNNQKFVNAVLRQASRKQHLILQSISEDKLPRHIYYSLPEWLMERLDDIYGKDSSREILRLANQAPLLSVRMRMPAAVVLQYFDDNQIKWKRVSAAPWLLIEDKEKFWQLPEEKWEYISIQDYSSGIAARLFTPQDGDMEILDMCAAPGGKSLQMLDSFANCKLHAVEASPIRLKTLQNTLNLAKNPNYRIENTDARQLSRHSRYSHILLDAPCSGLGSLRKRADLRWNRSPEQIGELVALQWELLSKAFQLLDVGGQLVYSTCSIEPRENQDLIAEFLQHTPNAAVDLDGLPPDLKPLPSGLGILLLPEAEHDGAYAIRLRKIRG